MQTEKEQRDFVKALLDGKQKTEDPYVIRAIELMKENMGIHSKLSDERVKLQNTLAKLNASIERQEGILDTYANEIYELSLFSPGGEVEKGE